MEMLSSDCSVMSAMLSLLRLSGQVSTTRMILWCLPRCTSRYLARLLCSQVRRSWPAPRMLVLCGVRGSPLIPQLSVGWLDDTKLVTES